MNRRSFLGRSLVVVATAALATTALPLLQGCPTKQSVESFINLIASTTASLATALGSSSLVAQIKSAAALAISTVDAWQAGGLVSNAIQALNAFQGVIELIPAIGPYTTLIDLAVGAIEGLLQLIPQSAVANLHRQPRLRVVHAMPYTKETPAQYKKQWNAIIAQHPELKAAKA